MKLTSLTTLPPGGFAYSQVFNGQVYTFPDVGFDIRSQTNIVLQFRKANGVPGATFDETLNDVIVFTCARLGNNPRFCLDGSENLKQNPNAGCSSCGIAV